MDYSRGSNLIAGRHHDGNPTAGLGGSRLEAEWINMVDDELVGLIEVAGIAPRYNTRDQLTQAVKVMGASALDIRSEGAASGGDVAANTRALQSAIDKVGQAGGGVVRIAGGLYAHGALACPYNDVRLEIEPEATLAPQVSRTQIIRFTGNRCAIAGGGLIRCLPEFDAKNRRNDIAVLWVAGHGFEARDIRFDTVPRVGIHFEEADDCRVIGVKANGRVPIATYGGVNTGHQFVHYNPRAGNLGGLTMQNCEIEGFVEGLVVGNYGAAAAHVGINVSNNRFRNCLDHAVYLIRDEGAVVSGNQALDCRIPIALSGHNSVVTGNVLVAMGTGQARHAQHISLRTAENALVANNILKGDGAAIDCSDVATPGTVSRNRIINNTLIQFAPSPYILPSIRLGSRGGRCFDNWISGNRIQTVSSHNSWGAIHLGQSAGGARGQRNVVADNSIRLLGAMSGVWADGQDDVIIRGNVIDASGDAASNATVNLINLGNAARPEILGNRISYPTGGARVAVRGVFAHDSVADGLIERNRILLTSASLTRTDEIVNASATTRLRSNEVNATSGLGGEVNYLAGAASHTVVNPNCRPDSIVHLTAREARAAAMNAFVVPGDGSFAIHAGAGGAPSYGARFLYTIT